MVVNTRLLVPMVLGVSLVAVSAFVAYYVLRRDEEEEQAADGNVVKTGRMHVIEVPVAKNLVPALIGRGGSNIKEIERKTGAKINFKKFPEKDADICLIRGNAQPAQLAETLIHEFINNQPHIEEEKMLVPAWACGRIIGSRGENINDISHRSGARVKVETGGPETNGQRTVTLRGTLAQIQLARVAIEKSVAQQKCLLEISESKSPRLSPGVGVGASEGAEAAPVPGDAPPLSKHASGRRAGGTSIEVYVSAVSSPSRFWVQFVGTQVSQLDSLVQHMSDYYGNKDNREQHALSEVSVGQVVAAVFRHDGRWYRARVDAIKQNEFAPNQLVADVFFLDYGDSEYVATHELCELRSDLLRLRFQAMECFLAGVRPAGLEEEVVCVTPDGQRWDKWHPQAIQRFEELTKVARWKSLMSATCTYRRAAGGVGERDRDIPGIKLYDAVEGGEVDIGATLVAEGWAVESALTPRASPAPSPRASPAAATPTAPPSAPFGDLGASRVLGMLAGDGEPAPSLPRDRTPAASNHTPAASNHTPADSNHTPAASDNTPAGLITPRKTDPNPPTLASNERNEQPSRTDSANTISTANLSYPDANIAQPKRADSTHDFLSAEKHAPVHTADPRDELKANMNRIDSHHGRLESLEQELHK